MKFSQFTVALAVLLAFVLGNSLAISEEGDAKDEQARRAAKIKRITSPGPQHKQLAYLLGEWDVSMRFAQAPTMPAIPMKSTFSWAIDGRWMAEEVKATVAIPGMGKMHEFFIHGYDNHTKNYVSVGVTNMDTQMNMFRGVKVDPEGKVFTQYGTINEWLDDTYNKPVKVVSKRVDDDHFNVEIWDLQIGETGAAVITMAYTRVKGG